MVATTVLGGLVLMFSAVFLVVILGIVAVAWTALMWKTRKLRKIMRNAPRYDTFQPQQEFGGEVIEGEVIHVDEAHDKIRGLGNALICG
jgi:hypothetical protein